MHQVHTLYTLNYYTRPSCVSYISIKLGGKKPSGQERAFSQWEQWGNDGRKKWVAADMNGLTGVKLRRVMWTWQQKTPETQPVLFMGSSGGHQLKPRPLEVGTEWLWKLSHKIHGMVACESMWAAWNLAGGRRTMWGGMPVMPTYSPLSMIISQQGKHIH